MNQSSFSGLSSLIALTLVLAAGSVTAVRAATEPPVPVRMVAPDYPYELKREGVTGIVSVAFEVDETGNVVDPKVLKSSNSAFDQSALNAIVKWKFKPGRKEGVPTKMKIAIPLQFKAEG